MAVTGKQVKTGFISAKQVLWKLSDVARQVREKHRLSPDMALGRKGEDLAHRYLQRSGFAVLARNYRPGGGESEVDIVARDGEILVFVEVKSRTSAEFGDPGRAIDPQKQSNIVKAARRYVSRTGVPWDRVRFDIVSIVFTQPPSIVHQQDAFFEGRAV